MTATRAPRITLLMQAFRKVAAGAALVLAAAPALLMAQQQSVVNSPHNLSASGPGNIRATSEDQVCIFCHAPHHTSQVKPLWNRQMSTAVYTPYRSNSLQAAPGQPTGSSKLCLSCHDGTIALGNVVSRKQEITMSNGVTQMPAGPGNLGTNLSDDHPISFPYDATLIQKNHNLKDPAGLTGAVKLDKNNELQCTSCHEPHNNQYGKFLVMDNTASQLCNTCHTSGTTTITAHNSCSSCHQSHTSPSGPYLLRGATVTATCTASACHGTQASQPQLNMANVLAGTSKHDTNSPVDQANHLPDNITCTDCHDPHTMGKSSLVTAPAISPVLGKIDGVNSLGAKVTTAQYSYEVCYKCHADQGTSKVTLISRVINQPNVRQQFLSSATSFHPVTAPGKGTNVPSLIPPLTTSSIIACTDCHGSDASKAAGGTGPNGPHGSNAKPVLIAGYTTADSTIESPSAYALCYKCHDRNSILSDRSFSKHHMHIVDERTSCSTCHDSHGVTSTRLGMQAAHLINFDTSVVRPEPATGRLGYTTTATGRGSCTLMCHGKAHVNTPYGGGAAPVSARTIAPPTTPTKSTATKR